LRLLNVLRLLVGFRCFDTSVGPHGVKTSSTPLSPFLPSLQCFSAVQ
jgi:hypothetical protein